MSVSLGPRSATPGPRSTSGIRGPPDFSSTVGRTPSRPPPVTPTGPCGTAKTTNKVPGVVKVEEEKVPHKEVRGFQPLKFSAQPSATVPKQKLCLRGVEAGCGSGSKRGPSVIAPPGDHGSPLKHCQ